MLWLLSVRSTLKENAEDTLCLKEVCVYMSDRSYRAVDNCSVQRLTGKTKTFVCMITQEKQPLSLLFSPVVFSKNHPKSCPLPHPSWSGLQAGGLVCFFVGDTRGSSIIVSMSATDRKVQKQSLSWWCGKMNSHHKKKEKRKNKNIWVVAIIRLQRNGGELLPNKDLEKEFWSNVKFLGCDLWF